MFLLNFFSSFSIGNIHSRMKVLRLVESSHFIRNIFQSNIYSQVRHYRYFLFVMYILKLFTKFNRI